MNGSSDKQPVWVKQAVIQHYRHIRPESGFTIEDLSPTLNVLHGPNGCGKSTTAMALRDLLWPARDISDYELTAASLQQGDQSWKVEVLGTKRTVQSIDGTAPEPPLSPPETRSRYVWTLRDLLSGSDRDLAARVAQEMAGGVDFHDVEQKLGATSPPSAPRKLQEEYRRIGTRLREARQSQKDLQTKARKMAGLRKRQADLSAEAALAPVIEQALDRLRLAEDLEQAQTKEKAFPPNMANLRHGDTDQARQASETLSRMDKELDTLKQERLELERHEPGWKAFAADDLQRGLREIQKAQQKLEEAERDLQQVSEALSGEESLERELRMRLGLTGEAIDKLTTGFDHPELRSWIQLVLKELSLEQDVVQLQERLGGAEAVDGHSLEELRVARRELEAAATQWLPVIPRLSPAAVTAWVLLLVVLITMQDHIPKWTYLLLTLPPLVGMGLHTLRRNNALSEVRKRVENVFRFPEPATPETFSSTLNDLDEAIKNAHAQELSDQDRERLQRLTQEQESIQGKVNALQDKVRTASQGTEVSTEWLGHFLEDVQRWRKQREKLAKAENRTGEAAAERADYEKGLRELCQPWDAKADAEILTTRLQEEVDRRQDLETLRIKSDTLSQTRKQAEQDLKSICDRNQLKTENWEDLIPRDNQLADWESLQQTIRLKTEQLNGLNDKLSDHTDLEALSREDLTARLERSRAASQESQDAFGDLKKLEQSISEAKAGRDLHQLQEDLERKRHELAADREQALHLRLKREVLDWLKDTVRENRRPEVLTAANRYLIRFTHGQLELSLSFADGAETFLAGRPGQPPRSLDTLSGGERAQVLMAVRLAFLDQQESAPMPLFVDEALGTSDDERADAILQTLIEIAREGRQVFYFTAQTDEVGKWKQALAQTDLQPSILNLGALRSGQPARPVELPSAAPIYSADLTRNDGESDADWAARLGVPDWHPHQPIEDLHLFLLFRDYETELARCLDYGVSSWGALQAMVKADATTHLISAETLANVQARATALDALAQAWRIGRPPPVPPEAILESGEVSDTFQEQVLDLLNEVHQQADKLLEGLDNKAVTGWRKNKTADLRDYLYKHDYLTSQPTLSEDEIKARAFAALKDTPHTGNLTPADWQYLLQLLS